ncbi:MAG: FAD-dependent oxidoreductase [Cyanobacteria bacterium P01_A01_bin.84]
MSHVVIVGCGVIGATVAYELSRNRDLKITVLDKQLPAQASTGAALGVLMGVISHKVKGKAWQLREKSIKSYKGLIPELEVIIGEKIPYNRKGILSLCFHGEDIEKWRKLRETRHSQGWELEIWDYEKLKENCPQVSNQGISGAIYSPHDKQVDPTALTLGLVKAGRSKGVNYQFDVNVTGLNYDSKDPLKVETTAGDISADWLVVAAGLGSSQLTKGLNQMVDIRPVLGQALHLDLGRCLGKADFQPVITGHDVHIVPVDECISPITQYWVGATVEFTQNGEKISPNKQLLDEVLQQAIAFCPELAEAKIIRTWSGSRPRPEGRPAPIIEKLSGYNNVLLATGHYRNGVLLAPATAEAIREMII